MAVDELLGCFPRPRDFVSVTTPVSPLKVGDAALATARRTFGVEGRTVGGGREVNGATMSLISALLPRVYMCDGTMEDTSFRHTSDTFSIVSETTID